AGAVPLFTIEPGYPRALALLEAPPPLIYAVGDRDLLNRPAVAIVGSRQASAAGMKLARLMTRGIAAAGYAIASGLARGIDGVAHEASLDTGTIAVVAGGVDVVYPPEHAELRRAIAERGVVVSEMPPGFQPRAKDFPRRNRLIAGLSLGVLVVEAARRSGTLVTARLATELGREVFAVPGHPLDPRAEGTNDLLKRGAIFTTSADDVVEALRPISGLAPRAFAEPEPATPLQMPKQPPPLIGEDERSRVLGALGPAPCDIDALVRATGLLPRTVSVVLMELEIAGRIVRESGQLISRIA
ncbi:MAG: DNA-processing protein DprA, partial [Hyphomicrobiaceae bacterium]